MASYVITGAARGIGLEFVTQISSDSNNIVFAIVRNKATATKLDNLPGNVKVLQADVTDSKALKLAAAEVAKVTGGKLDYLINNAARSDDPGYTLDGFPNDELLEENLLDNFKINTIGVVHTINAFLPLLRQGSVKKVISLSSGMGDLDLTLQSESGAHPSYCISKAALNMVVAKYAAQFKEEGFVFLAISPGLVNTAVGPHTAQELEAQKVLAKSLFKLVPDFKGPITPQESVKLQLGVIYSWTVAETGAFVSHLGNKQWV
ncbi:hypothetical protein C8J57DRAFT_1383373 [Mycena rebaudengoi]|nr:hypothetical protein C8J57DRAFT_1383373 [Mycena rebaudengoi]